MFFPIFPNVFFHFPYDFPMITKSISLWFMDPIDYSCKHHKLVGDLEHFLFSNILRMIIPTDELIFFRGVGQPPTSILCIYYIYHSHQHNYGKSSLLMERSPLFMFINWAYVLNPFVHQRRISWDFDHSSGGQSVAGLRCQSQRCRQYLGSGGSLPWNYQMWGKYVVNYGENLVITIGF